MRTSIVEFKIPSANLHKKSPRIFLASLIVSIVFTGFMIHLQLPEQELLEYSVTVKPVIIHLENIPETRQTVRTPAPSKPFIPGSMPVEVDDELIPDEITIENTSLDINTVPSAPPTVLVPKTGATAEEDEIFEYFAVEEPPVRIDTIIPEYPDIANRTGIEGNVIMKVLVNRKGLVDSVEVIDGPKIFHKPSIDAAKATKFTPAKHNDRPVSCWIIMPFKFVIEK